MRTRRCSGRWQQATDGVADVPLAANVLQLGPGLDVRGGVASVERLILEHCGSDIEIRHVATVDDGWPWRKAQVFLRAMRQLRRALKVRQPLVVHIHFSKRGSTARKSILAWMTLRARRPLILHAHSGSFDRFFLGLPRFLQQLLLKVVFSRADCLVVLSNYWREFYTRSCGLRAERIVVLHNPVALPESVPARANRRQVQLFYLGRISENKGAFDLLRAYRALPPQLRSRTRVVFAGDGKVEELRAAAGELGAAVEVHSWIDTQQRDALLSASDIFVLPSYYEGVPMAMLEAMAHGLPVIATRVGGIPDVLDDQIEGLLVAPGQPGELLAALCRLIEDENRRLELGRCARMRARAFDVRQYTADLAGIYRRVLERHEDAWQGSSSEAI